MNVTHTELPWIASGVSVIGADKRRVCSTVTDHRSYDDDSENAAFIVKAVNAHDKLVEALKRIVATGVHEVTYREIMSDPSHYVNAALAAAGEQV
jgi:hypothetical protein